MILSENIYALFTYAIKNENIIIDFSIIVLVFTEK